MPSKTQNKAQRVEQAQKYHELMKTPQVISPLHTQEVC